MEMIRTSPSGCGARGEAQRRLTAAIARFAGRARTGLYDCAEADIEIRSFRFSGLRGALTGDHGQT